MFFTYIEILSTKSLDQNRHIFLRCLHSFLWCVFENTGKIYAIYETELQIALH